MKNFLEYMNSKGKVEAPTVKVLADKVDCPEGRKYAPEQKGVGKVHAYSNGKSIKTEKEKGFGDQGHDNLKYSPCKDSKKEVKAAKLPTTENYDLLQSVRELIQEEPTFVEHLVREFKRHGLLAILMGEMIDHKETFESLAEVMANKAYGPEVCKKLAKALHEDIAPPFAKSIAAPSDAVPTIDPNAPEGEEGDEEVSLDGDLPTDDGMGDDAIGGEEAPPEEEDDIEIGPDGLPVSKAPAIGPDGLPVKKPAPPMLPQANPAMENLLAALKIIKG